MHMTIVTPIPTSRGYCTLLAGLAHSTHEEQPIDYVLLDNGKYFCALKYPKQQHRYLCSVGGHWKLCSRECVAKLAHLSAGLVENRPCRYMLCFWSSVNPPNARPGQFLIPRQQPVHGKFVKGKLAGAACNLFRLAPGHVAVAVIRCFVVGESTTGFGPCLGSCRFWKHCMKQLERSLSSLWHRSRL